jgi:hypothetical protein
LDSILLFLSELVDAGQRAHCVPEIRNPVAAVQTQPRRLPTYAFHPQWVGHAGGPLTRAPVAERDVELKTRCDKVDFVCLWNGKDGDGRGGTPHIMDAVRSRGGRTSWLDTTKLRN